jgi:type IV secretory pathway VirB4 component
VVHRLTLLRSATTQTRAPAGLPAPDSVEIGARQLTVGSDTCRSFAVVGYPAEVGPGWLEPLLAYPGRLDIAVHVEPVPAQLAADRLRRQLARLESGRRADTAKGRLVDPSVEAAAADARELAGRLARGQGKLFRVGLYLTVHASDPAELDGECERVRALAASLLMDVRPATFRSLQGWLTTLPIGQDQLKITRTMDTAALAAAFPFASADLPGQNSTGVLYGRNVKTSGLVVWDRFGCDNHNAVILARSGAGKSYLAKLEALRSLYRGIDVTVIDPEDEYARLAAAVAGTHLRLGAPGVRLNPLDLPAGAGVGSDALTRRALFCHTLLGVLLGAPLSAAEHAALDRTVIAAYHQAGITADPRSWARPAPLLSDLAAVLRADGEAAAADLAARLGPYVTGSYAGLFDGPTTTRPDGHLVVFSLRELPDELKPVGTLLTLDAVWLHVSNSAVRRRRLVVVDEAWLLMREAEGAKFLFRMAKAARKHWAGLTVVTQDTADLLGSDLGQAVVANAATQILLRQAPQSIDALADAFHLSDGERQFLLTAPRGDGLLAAGTDRVAFHALASPAEHALITTDPAELADLDDDPDAGGQ